MKTNGTLAGWLRLLALICSTQSLLAAPLGTAFTYQGKLASGTNAANGSYDLKFALYDALSSGSAVAEPLTNTATGITNGLFLVPLDFGAAFDGNARWLQIEVRTNGSGTFTGLTPRQALTPTPYSLFASSTATLGGQAPSYYAPASGSAAYVTKSGDTMTGALNLPANGLSAGGNQLVLTGGNVGIGTVTPAYPLVVQKRSLAEPALMIGGGFARGPRLNTYGLDSNPQAWMGLGTDMSYSGWEHNLYFPVGDATNGVQSFGSYNGSTYSEKMRITAAGNVGIGTTTPTVKLEVAGTIKAASFISDGSQLSGPPRGMALIPAGAFTMGDNLDGLVNAIPVGVTLSAFYMDVNLVSYSQWQSVYFWATSHGYGFVHAGSGQAANHPVQTVDWYDCVKWCNARSQQAGETPVYYADAGLTQVYTNGEVTPYVNWTASGYRLPTEAEWEKAARGGLSGQRFPWGNVITENLANYYGDTGYSYDLGPNGYNMAFVAGFTPFTSPVGYFAPNGYGLYDMAGNVAEWCWDWYGMPYAGGSDPRGPASGNYRVQRGGEWNYSANGSQCAYRNSVGPIYAVNNFGFRCVRGL